MNKLFLSSVLIFASNIVFSQNIDNFDFEKYPAKSQNTEKKPLKNQSHSLTKSYAEISKSLYETSDVNFGGHYIVLNIGSTNYETSAVLADVSTGRIYDIPENKEPFSPEAISKCLDEETFITKPTSTLLIVNNFTDGQFDKPVKNYYSWNEKTKKFKLLKTEKLTCKTDN